MAVKFKLQAAPTFKAKVEIPVHGGKAVPVEVEFKHRTKDQLTEWLDGAKGRKDTEALLDLIAGWELDDPLNAESVELLVQNYAGAASAIVSAYVAELIQARRGN